MNSINLIGNICNNVESNQTTTGKSVLSINLAVKRPFAQDITDFIPVVVWNQSADYLSRYAHIGTKIAVTGKLTTRKYEDKTGNKHTLFEVVADSVEICEPKNQNEQKPAAQTPPNPAGFQNGSYTPGAYSGANNAKFEEIPNDGDLPF